MSPQSCMPFWMIDGKLDGGADPAGDGMAASI